MGTIVKRRQDESVRNTQELRLVALDTALGAIAYVESPAGLQRLLIGYRNRSQAIAALADEFPVVERVSENRGTALADLLRRFAEGESIDFADIAIDVRTFSEFRLRVTKACRAIPYGKVWTYSELAEKAGSPGAIRAAGTVMARNPFPLVVPCHRVVRTDGGLGGFSAPQGVDFKKRLQALEAACPRP